MAKSHANANTLRQVLRVFALFGHPLRVVIFQRLSRTPMTAGELARGLPISRTAVVQHLKQFEGARLVKASTEGRRRVYRVCLTGLAPLDSWLENIRASESSTNVSITSAVAGQTKSVARRRTSKNSESFAAGVGRGLRMAEKSARKIARMYGTPIYFWRNGRVVAEKP